MRGFSCQACVAGCKAQALELLGDGIRFHQDKCTECGICSVLCPGDAFAFEGVNLIGMLEERNSARSLVVSCCRNKHCSENELRLPCIGMLPAEFLVLLGLRHSGDVLFNLSECSGCTNCWAAERFEQQLHLVQEEAGHLFLACLHLAIRTTDLQLDCRHDRRKFLWSVGGGVVDLLAEKLRPRAKPEEGERGTRWIPVKVRLLQRILDCTSSERNMVGDLCMPSLTVSSSCSHCPRCVGMCPTGALKMRKDGTKKSLSYDRSLCTACGLCVEFCKETALSIQRARVDVETMFTAEM